MTSPSCGGPKLVFRRAAEMISPSVTYAGQGSPYALYFCVSCGIMTYREGGVAVAWCVYILRCRDGSLYTGCTNDIAHRLAVHQSGKGAKYTRSRLPVCLVYQEEVAADQRRCDGKAPSSRLTREQKLRLLTEQKISISELDQKRIERGRKKAKRCFGEGSAPYDSCWPMCGWLFQFYTEDVLEESSLAEKSRGHSLE